MHGDAATAVTRFFSAIFEPTGDYPSKRSNWQIWGVKSRSVGEATRFRWDANSIPYSLFREARGDFFALFRQLFRNDAAERVKKLFVLGQFLFPIFVVDLEQFVDAFVIDLELRQIEIVNARQPTDRRFQRAVAALATIDHPFENAHVVAETGPEKFSGFAFAEPVHVKYERRVVRGVSHC